MMQVVPVPSSTIDRWTYPPFSGHYDGTYIWGRGSEDDKSNLIAMLVAMTALLDAGFIPNRTIILAVGFDEEGGAEEGYGAKGLAECLLKTYGEDSMELIVRSPSHLISIQLIGIKFDEGIAGIESHFGIEMAMPATAEKGYIDVTVTVNTEGGHSSTPPDHTASKFFSFSLKKKE